jgi:hypothetical protein
VARDGTAVTPRPDCAAFELWLNDGRPAGDHTAPRHATTCGRCAALLEADLALGAWLGIPAARVPVGFTDRVMQRIDALPATSRAHAPVAPPAMAWWLDALRQPASVLAATCSGLLVWRLDRVAAAGAAAAAWLASPLQIGVAWSTHALTLVSPAATGGGIAVPMLALALGVLPSLLLGSLAVARWAERMTAR